MTMIARLVMLYAALLLLAGVALLFAPEVLVPGGEDADPLSLVLAQLVGGALIGFAAASWTARGALLGGIYGRAVVMGNQVFTFIAVLVLLNRLASASSGVGLWMLLGILTYGAVLFAVLLYRGPRLGRAAHTTSAA